MKYQQCQIVWTPPLSPGDRSDPLAGHVEVIPHPAKGQGRDYNKSIGACFGHVARLTPDQVTAQVFIDFANLVREDRMDVDRVHRAFMDIDEYRELYLAEPMIGYARPDDSDPRAEWQGMEISIADLPTWDEAVGEIGRAADIVARADAEVAESLRQALLREIMADARGGRELRVRVQALRLALNVHGALEAGRALELIDSAAEALREAR